VPELRDDQWLQLVLRRKSSWNLKTKPSPQNPLQLEGVEGGVRGATVDS